MPLAEACNSDSSKCSEIILCTCLDSVLMIWQPTPHSLPFLSLYLRSSDRLYTRTVTKFHRRIYQLQQCHKDPYLTQTFASNCEKKKKITTLNCHLSPTRSVKGKRTDSQSSYCWSLSSMLIQYFLKVLTEPSGSAGHLWGTPALKVSSQDVRPKD